MKLETVGDLEAAIERQNLALEAMQAREARQDDVIAGLGELVKGMDLKIRMQQALIDNHHDVFIKAGLAAPRPAEDPLVH